MSGEGVGDDEEFVSHGNEGDLFGFAFGDEPMGEGPAAGVGSHAGEGGHVEDVADLFAAAPAR